MYIFPFAKKVYFQKIYLSLHILSGTILLIAPDFAVGEMIDAKTGLFLAQI